MGNPFKSKPSAPAPTPTPVVEKTPDKTEVTQAKTQAQTAKRRRGTMGRQTSLLSGGYRGFLDQDTLG